MFIKELQQAKLKVLKEGKLPVEEINAEVAILMEKNKEMMVDETSKGWLNISCHVLAR
jgi:hypothetical protein